MHISTGTRCVNITAPLPHLLTTLGRPSQPPRIDVTLRNRYGKWWRVLDHQRRLSSSVASTPPQRFESTHTQREWNPAQCKASADDKLAAAAGTVRAKLDTSPQPSPAAAHPYSVRAYRTRLMHGTYSSLRELTRAAYAPAPLKLLTDLLQLSVNHAPHHTELSSSSSSVATSPATSTSFAQSCAQAALSRARDVHHILQLAMSEARDTVLAAQTLGDIASHVDMRELLAELEMLANTIDACARAPLSTTDGTLSASPPWVVPIATHVTLLRGLLQLATVTGAHLQALTALNDLLSLQERGLLPVYACSQNAKPDRDHGKESREEDADDSIFSMDDALALVDAAAQQHVEPVTAQDHLCAMQACAKEHHRDFATTLSLYRRLMQHAEAGRFPVAPDDVACALIALAHSSRTTTDFTELRRLLVDSEAAAVVPVSVPLYTALIDAASRAVEEPQRMVFALHMYRRLRDGGLALTADTYAALIACCASTREPTHAFAFYHEARQVCGTTCFTPQVYTNLLLSYTTAGFGADARRTLDVLVEAGAPLSRASFHAALASAVTVREAQEVVQLMTERYHIAPTPHTHAYVVQAVAKSPAGISSALQLFDIHEEVMQILAQMADPTERSCVGMNRSEAQVDRGQALSTTASGVALEPLLVERYPLYVRALEQALMHLRVDPSMDSRLRPYLMPLIRVVQQRMNAFTGMSPQSPTHVPQKERLCIAVLAADVLANLDEWVLPFISHYSVLVIPYSALVSLQRGGGRRIDGAMAKGAQAALHDTVWQEVAGGQEIDAVVEHRRRRLVRFLDKYKSVIHLMSLEEELRWSRETRRYGIGVTNIFARAAATALHLARHNSLTSSSSVYAQHPNASVVLVSASFDKCGKYIVALKQAHARGTTGSGTTARQAERVPGLRDALRRVSYHNPRTNPNWAPPTLAIVSREEEGKNEGQVGRKSTRKSSTETSDSSAVGADDGSRDAALHDSALDTDTACELYRSSLQSSAQQHEVVQSKCTRIVTDVKKSTDYRSKVAMGEREKKFQAPFDQNSSTTSSIAPILPLESSSASTHAEDNLDAVLLMSLLSD